MCRVMRVVIAAVASFAVLFAAFLVVSVVTDYRPADIVKIDVKNPQESVLSAQTEFTVTTFNIGYCGLDKDADFFMDGGTMSRAVDRDHVEANIEAVVGFLREQSSDFFAIQEVDLNSSRSFLTDQRSRISDELSEYSHSHAVNYKVAWVPVPLNHPHGKVLSGIMTMSRHNVANVSRYSLPGKHNPIVQLFMLDRCIMESRVPVENGRELVMVNLHLSAYDKGGTIRNQQLSFLKRYALEEFSRGNYVVLAGDWNHLLSECQEARKADYGDKWPDWLQLLPDDFTPEGWQWAVDEQVPTCRDNDRTYDPDVSFVTWIDGFLVSPNIEVIEVAGHDLGFEHSDHNPVTARLRFTEH